MSSTQNAIGAQVQWWIKRSSGMIFDAVHRVDTGAAGVIPETVEIPRPHRYDPSSWQTLNRSLQLASLRAEGLTFVDFGCGKGKVLLSALALPFERVVGVELSPLLCQIAESNVASARFIHRRCPTAQIICTDAVEYPIPGGRAVFFFSNPFAYEIIEIVLGAIVGSFLRRPRPLYLIFHRTPNMPKIKDFLHVKSGGCARLRVSSSIGRHSINIFDFRHGQ